MKLWQILAALAALWVVTRPRGGGTVGEIEVMLPVGDSRAPNLDWLAPYSYGRILF